jgi:hypothetical protein
MAFKMKMKTYGQGKNPIPMKKAPTKAKTKLKDNTYVDEATMEAKADHARQQRAYAAENQSANIDDLGTKAEVVTKMKKKSSIKLKPNQAMGGAKNKPAANPKPSSNFPRFS